MVTNEMVSAKLQKLKVKKAIVVCTIPGKVVMDEQETFTNILQELYNVSINDGIFPSQLKMGKVASVFTAND